ncbi:MAG: hypothetical protein QXZ12_03750 [Thermoplasmata archaeon]
MSNLRVYLIVVLFFLGLLSVIESIFLMLYVDSLGESDLGSMYLVTGIIIAFLLLLFAGAATIENKNSNYKIGQVNTISVDNNENDEIKNNKN